MKTGTSNDKQTKALTVDVDVNSEIEPFCDDKEPLIELIDRVPGVRKHSKSSASDNNQKMASSVGKKYMEIAIVVAVYW